VWRRSKSWASPLFPVVLSESELQVTRGKLDETYEIQVKEVGGEERLNAMNDLNVVRLLLAYDDYFLNVATNPAVLAIVERLLRITTFSCSKTESSICLF